MDASAVIVESFSDLLDPSERARDVYIHIYIISFLFFGPPKMFSGPRKSSLSQGAFLASCVHWYAGVPVEVVPLLKRMLRKEFLCQIS